MPRARFLAAPLALALIAWGATAVGEGETAESATSSVTSGNGVVVHDVDTTGLAARLREVDTRATAGDSEELAKQLSELLAGDLNRLVQESFGVYLQASEAAVLRAAGADSETLAAYRSLVDDRAEQALELALKSMDLELLARAAHRNALSTHGPRLLVTLADLRVARGQLDLAVQALEGLLRYWPEHADTHRLTGVVRSDVISRLAGLYAAHGDVAGVLRLRDTASEALLAAPAGSPSHETLVEELDAAVGLARTRATAVGPGPGPKSALKVVGEIAGYARDPEDPALLTEGREVAEYPVVVPGDEGPLLISRITSEQPRVSRLVALGPPKPDAPVLRGGGQLLDVRWLWPDDQRVRAFHRALSTNPFAPAVAGDLLIFPWASTRESEIEIDSARFATGEPLYDLVVLSLAHEGRDVDIRGSNESLRSDPDETLERLSFCGRPLVQGNTVFATAVGRAATGGATELHVVCFDIEHANGSGATRLRERWRTHVLDGQPLPAVRYAAEGVDEFFQPLALPTGIAERYGRLYVGSNTGALACLDARDGRVEWVETYDQGPRSARTPVKPARPHTWKDVPLLVDGPYIHLAPRDAEQFFRFGAAPLLPSRSLLVDRITVRGGGTSVAAGSVLGTLLADDVLSVHDGIAVLAGDVPPRGLSAILPAGSPLVSYRLRDARTGEGEARLDLAQIPENRAAGRAVLTREGMLFPTFKGIYRVPLDDLGAAPVNLWKPRAVGGFSFRRPDRLGNLVPAGDWLWSVTPSRVVLFKAE